MEAIKSMNHKKAPGPDHLTSDICQHFIETYPTQVTNLFNRCMHLSHFPTSWKTAFIKTIPKPNKQDYNDISSYRPIGLINVFGKLLEKLIAKRLSYYMYINNTANDRQYGFKEQKTTTDALRDAINHMKQAKAQNKLVAAISLDIEGAFNHAWWPALLYRLKKTKMPKKPVQNYSKLY
ncbi:unnamed protein product [Parnassius mnemosyne]|uniref:Reverse transcriptase domain-containing protein n=1 Tax=Parnassius mnemosyne TaxID=213953 RepID=A0AAV1M2A9_9NEOP